MRGPRWGRRPWTQPPVCGRRFRRGWPSGTHKLHTPPLPHGTAVAPGTRPCPGTCVAPADVTPALCLGVRVPTVTESVRGQVPGAAPPPGGARLSEVLWALLRQPHPLDISFVGECSPELEGTAERHFPLRAWPRPVTH